MRDANKLKYSILISWPMVIFAFALIIYAPHAMLIIKYLGLICACLLLLYMVLPQRRIIFCQTQNNEKNAGFWLLGIIIQVASLIFFLSMVQSMSQWLPLHHQLTTYTHFSFANLFNLLFYLQPFAIITLLTILIADCGYRRRQDPILNNVLSPILGKQTYHYFGISVLYYSNLAHTFILAWLTCLLTLLISHGLTHLFGFTILSGMSLPSLLLATILLIPILSPLGEQCIDIMTYHQLPLGCYQAVLIISSVLIILLLSGIIALITHFHLQHQFPIQQLTHYPVNQHSVMALFTLSWWLLITPLQSSLLARLCQGRRLFSIIINYYLMPSMIVFVCYSLNKHYHLIDWQTLSPYWSMTILSLGLIAYFILLFFIKDTRLHMIGLMKNVSDRGFTKLSRLLRLQFLACAMLTALYLLNGVFFVHVISFVQAFSMLFIIILSIPSLVITLGKGAHHDA